MKILFTIVIALTWTLGTCSQNISSFLKKEQAFRSFQLNILEVSIHEDPLINKHYNGQFYSNDEGFIYMNFPDSIIVIYCPSNENDFKISERFRINQIHTTNPIVASIFTDDHEKIILKVLNENGLKIQFYYPETEISANFGNQMMAYEFDNLHVIKSR
tara:strand:- start:20353 stop:20829 length:477 start_codon:yes stop_codon:yes gene_type:complete